MDDKMINEAEALVQAKFPEIDEARRIYRELYKTVWNNPIKKTLYALYYFSDNKEQYEIYKKGTWARYYMYTVDEFRRSHGFEGEFPEGEKGISLEVCKKLYEDVIKYEHLTGAERKALSAEETKKLKAREAQKDKLDVLDSDWKEQREQEKQEAKKHQEEWEAYIMDPNNWLIDLKIDGKNL